MFIQKRINNSKILARRFIGCEEASSKGDQGFLIRSTMANQKYYGKYSVHFHTFRSTGACLNEILAFEPFSLYLSTSFFKRIGRTKNFPPYPHLPFQVTWKSRWGLSWNSVCQPFQSSSHNFFPHNHPSEGNCVLFSTKDRRRSDLYDGTDLRDGVDTSYI